MVISPNNILQHELIGLKVEVIEVSHSSKLNIKGTIIDETMKTFLIKNNGIKRVPKKNTVFKFKLNTEAVKVEGNAIMLRPEDRIKKSKKREW